MEKDKVQGLETAIFACGCYWCVEAQFQHLKGVTKIEPGYTGGHVVNPTYEMVCTGMTGHAESCRITFDPQIITFRELLFAFFKAHDPTQLNRQGNDIGTQYRSALFYLNESQHEEMERMIQDLKDQKVYDHPIVTTIQPAMEFYVAEDYMHDYYNHHPENPYCQVVVKAKVRHFLSYLEEKERAQVKEG